jgi:hypothetical protein
MKKNHCLAMLRTQIHLQKPKISWLLFLLCLSFYCIPAAAQTRTISGRITDGNNQPLEGVSVGIKGTDAGTASNAQGNYSINVANAADILTSKGSSRAG